MLAGTIHHPSLFLSTQQSVWSIIREHSAMNDHVDEEKRHERLECSTKSVLQRFDWQSIDKMQSSLAITTVILSYNYRNKNQTRKTSSSTWRRPAIVTGYGLMCCEASRSSRRFEWQRDVSLAKSWDCDDQNLAAIFILSPQLDLPTSHTTWRLLKLHSLS